MGEIGVFSGTNAAVTIALPAIILLHGRPYVLDETRRGGLIMRAAVENLLTAGSLAADTL